MKFETRNTTGFDPTVRLERITLIADNFEEEQFIASILLAFLTSGQIEVDTGNKLFTLNLKGECKTYGLDGEQ